ncbi:MAG: aminoacetone oxidase family FAD-binding enzyme [Bacteroidetes bacterium]|nr:aminoacetone oxidase family FAD-binding enzyme [Bacteroidota bacterium]
MNKRLDIIVVGGGAAGFFAAINIAEKCKNAKITIIEKGDKLLQKVKISGGGRCNISNNCNNNLSLVKNYPRGEKELMQVFARFNVSNTVQWFNNHGLALKVENDERMFPKTNSSQTVIDCFLKLAVQLNVNIELKCALNLITKTETGFTLNTTKGIFLADALICAIGGFNKIEHYSFLQKIGHKIIKPIPSLFTFNLPENPITKQLQGVAIKNVKISLTEFKKSYEGDVLITHWGLSGPVVLKLSAFCANELHEKQYETKITINFISSINEEQCFTMLLLFQKNNFKKNIRSNAFLDLPKRLCEYLTQLVFIESDMLWADVPQKKIRQLSTLICAFTLQMKGKTTFKEEFVTCGGIDLKEIDFKTMQSKVIKNLFFCGEVINVDGITGGFNFQNAWSTAWICSENFNSSVQKSV